jgi:hypothetical protein
MKHIKTYGKFTDVHYLKSYKIFEAVTTKRELVNKIKYLSNYLHNYLKDVNKFTGSNLNSGFSYDTELEIRQIFDVTENLDENSPDGFITAISNEFITWSNYFIIGKSRDSGLVDELKTFQLDENYENYDDEYKKSNHRKLYDQRVYRLLYIYVGQTIKQMISGTSWDIPNDDKEFTEEDKDFIFDSLRSDYDITSDYNMGGYEVTDRNTKWEEKRGLIIKLPLIGNRWSSVEITNDSDFMYRLQSYFGGAIIIPRYYEYYKIYLPFYKK